METNPEAFVEDLEGPIRDIGKRLAAEPSSYSTGDERTLFVCAVALEHRALAFAIARRLWDHVAASVPYAANVPDRAAAIQAAMAYVIWCVWEDQHHGGEASWVTPAELAAALPVVAPVPYKLWAKDALKTEAVGTIKVLVDNKVLLVTKRFAKSPRLRVMLDASWEPEAITRNLRAKLDSLKDKP